MLGPALPLPLPLPLPRARLPPPRSPRGPELQLGPLGGLALGAAPRTPVRPQRAPLPVDLRGFPMACPRTARAKVMVSPDSRTNSRTDYDQSQWHAGSASAGARVQLHPVASEGGCISMLLLYKIYST